MARYSPIERVSPTGETVLLVGGEVDKKSWAADEKYLSESQKVADLLNGGHQLPASPTWNSTGYLGGNNPKIQSTLTATNQVINGSDVVFYDFEAVGTPTGMRKGSAPAGFYGITEIAMNRFQFKGNKFQGGGNALSILVNPGQDAIVKLEGIIRKLEQFGWGNLSMDERRSISDVSQYGRGAKVSKMGGLTLIDAHGRKFAGPSLATPEGLEQVRIGFKRLKGASALEDALARVNTFASGAVLSGHNVNTYDKPALFDVLQHQSKGSEKAQKIFAKTAGIFSRPQLDTIELARSLSGNHMEFGDNMKLGGIYGMLTGNKAVSAHLGAADIGMSKKVTEILLGNYKKRNVHRAVEKMKRDVVKRGDLFYSKKGMMGGNNAYDVILDKTENGYVPVGKEYGAFNKAAEYSVVHPVQREVIDGVTRFGITLKNHDTGYHHHVVRDTIDEIHSIFQQNMERIDPDNVGVLGRYLGRRKEAEADRSRRHFDLLFDPSSGKGTRGLRREYSMLDSYKAARQELSRSIDDKLLLHKKAVDKALEEINADTDPEYHVGRNRMEKVVSLEGRLEAERGVWDSALKEIESERMSPFQQTVAMGSVKRQLEESYGISKDSYSTGGRQMFSITGHDGQQKMLSMDDPFSTNKDVRSILWKEGTSSGQERVLKRMLDELEEKGVFSKDESMKLRRQAREQYFRNNQTLPVNFMQQLATDMRRSVIAQGLGQGSIDIESIQTSAYGMSVQSLMSQDERGGKLFMEQVVARAIEEAKVQTDNSSLHAGYTFENGRLRNKLQEHKDRVALVHRVSGMQGNPLVSGESIDEKLKKMINTYSKDYSVRLDIDDAGERVFFMLGEKGKGGQLQKMSFAQAIASNQVAHMEIGLLDKDGQFNFGGQKLIARQHGKRMKNGGMVVQDSASEIIDRITNFFGNIEKQRGNAELSGRKYSMLDVHRSLSKWGKGVAEGLITNGDRHSANPERDVVRTSPSSNMNRSMQLDVKEFAEDWYIQRGRAFGLKGLSRVQDKAEHSSEFYGAMSQVEKGYFHRDINNFINEVYFGGKQVISSDGLSASQANNGVRQMKDSRSLVFAGAYSPTARENVVKSLNYRTLAVGEELETVESKLVKRYGAEKAYRLTGGLGKTAEAMEATSGMLTHLNARALHTGEAQLALMTRGALQQLDQMIQGASGKKLVELQLLRREIGELGNITVHDGMMIVSKKLQDALTVSKSREIDLGVGKMDERLQELFRKRGHDLSSSVNLDEAISYNELKAAGLIDEDGKGNRFTAGTYANITLEEQKIGHFNKWHKNYRVTGFDAERNRVLLEETVNARQGTKIITSSGGRHAVRFVSQKALEFITGNKDVDAVLPNIELKKAMGGDYVASEIQSYADEIRRQVFTGDMKGEVRVAAERLGGRPNLTAGDLAKSDFLDDIMSAVFAKGQSHLGMADGVLSFQGGSPILSGEPGVNLSKEKMLAFRGAMEKATGFSVVQNGHEVRNVGLGLHDIEVYESAGNKLKVGKKIMHALQNTFSGDAEGMAYVDFMQEQIRKNEKYIPAMEIRDQLVGHMDQSGPKAGDFVIDMSGRTVGDDVNQVFKRNGINFVDINAVQALPNEKITMKDMVFVGSDYNGTIVNTSGTGVLVDGERRRLGALQEGRLSYMQLPDGIRENSYVPLVDVSGLTKMDDVSSPMLLQVQKAQERLYRDIKDYHGLGVNGGTPDELAKRKRELIESIGTRADELEATTAQFATSARKGGLLDKLGSTKLEQSHQYRITGVNVFDSHRLVDGKIVQNMESMYRDGFVYHSRGYMSQAIDGAEEGMAKALFGEGDWAKMDRGELKNKILDHITAGNPEGGSLYGMDVRFPVTEKASVRMYGFMIDPTMDGDDRTGRMTAGTMKIQAGDADGDVKTASFDHYKDPKRADMFHRALQRGQQRGQADVTNLSVKFMNEYASELETVLTSQGMAEEQAKGLVQRTMAGETLTVGGMTLEGFDAAQTDNFFRLKNSIEDKLLTNEALFGKGGIGIMDNLREDVMTLHDTTRRTLLDAGRIDQRAYNESSSIVERLMQNVSQNSISSKQLSLGMFRDQAAADGFAGEDLENEAKRRLMSRSEKLGQLRSGILNIGRENMDEVKGLISEMGIVKAGETFKFEELGLEMKGEDLVDRALRDMSETRRLNRHRGGFQSDALGVSRSTGIEKEEIMTRVLRQDAFIPTTAVEQFYADIPEGDTSRLTEMRERYKMGVLNQFDALHQHGELMNEGVAQRFQETSMERIANQGGGTATDAMQRSGRAASAFAGETMNAIKRSSFMPVAGAMAGIWGAASLMRSGPTPEGNIAQQEAAQMNVSPEQLLTSPTARVTTNTNQVLRIKGTGANVDHNALAAIINQEAQQMGQTKLDLNININDNTASLSNKWFQDQINGALI